jgi:hypothetical protein
MDEHAEASLAPPFPPGIPLLGRLARLSDDLLGNPGATTTYNQRARHEDFGAIFRFLRLHRGVEKRLLIVE